MALRLDFTMDAETNRQYLNGHPVVMHSHHYLALITKMAGELEDINGTGILRDVVEETMRAVFDDYIRKNGLTSAQDKCNVGREYFSVFGLGKMVITGDEQGGEVRLVRSHLDEGWIMKWGNTDKPVNHFTCGYVAAMFGAAFDKPLKSYTVTEAASIAAGDSEGKFIVKVS
ncbi:MAG TPA: 4-vinyl reductase [Geobacteraceae bacterium]|nr:4-vinyl reductase [Geobacteraceae bacterium]